MVGCYWSWNIGNNITTDVTQVVCLIADPDVCTRPDADHGWNQENGTDRNFHRRPVFKLIHLNICWNIEINDIGHFLHISMTFIFFTSFPVHELLKKGILLLLAYRYDGLKKKFSQQSILEVFFFWLFLAYQGDFCILQVSLCKKLFQDYILLFFAYQFSFDTKECYVFDPKPQRTNIGCC